MARGRHGAIAAKKRAESAEEQLDRLLPKLVDAERLLKQYRSEAEMAPILRAELKRAREQIGVPVERHEAEVAEIKDAWAAQRQSESAAWMTIIKEWSAYLDTTKLRCGPDDPMPMANATALEALRAVPKELADEILRRCGLERLIRRFLLQPTTASRARQENAREAMQLAVAARSAGYDGIPSSWVFGRNHTDHPDEPDDDDQVEAAS